MGGPRKLGVLVSVFQDHPKLNLNREKSYRSKELFRSNCLSLIGTAIRSEGSGNSDSEDGDVVNLPESLRGECDLARGFGADCPSSLKPEQLA